MAIELTRDALEKVAAQFSGLLEWIKGPPNETINTVLNEEEPKSSLYPELHSLIAENLEQDGLEYTFRQNDQKWESNSIAIRIREYEGSQYNVQVYHQRCSRCEKPTRAKLNKLAYADRVAFHFKRWNGIDAVPPTVKVNRKSNHRKELCEGCKKGHCGDNRGTKK
ncbi:hypothetical protein FDENT_8997 [Fusarium denticulatum]|uniref:3CxxC-type domain-containing protein n=1 Tax=Fusarium denticulatum TaxID=48507 RepID=A0A8H5TZA1_9HYPO|nr:hypothetical protein FDENT_8997 [Fusarium denticulatum]